MRGNSSSGRSVWANPMTTCCLLVTLNSDFALCRTRTSLIFLFWRDGTRCYFGGIWTSKQNGGSLQRLFNWEAGTACPQWVEQLKLAQEKSPEATDYCHDVVFSCPRSFSMYTVSQMENRKELHIYCSTLFYSLPCWAHSK